MTSSTLTFTSQFQSHTTEFLHLQPISLPEVVGTAQVKVKFLAAPVNVLDLVVLAGKYPVKPQTKYDQALVPGYEGVGVVIEVGGLVTALRIGEHVLPKDHGLGTWRTHTVVDADKLVRIPTPSNPVFASLLKMGYTPAYLLLQNMQYLKAGDWVIQNTATGMIAQAVIQFARLQGVRTVNIMRDRKDFDVVRSRLLALSADMVLSESQLEALVQVQPLSHTRRIVLAIDSVFGSSGSRIANQLVQGGTYVSLGFLGGGGEVKLDVNEGLLFYKAVEFKGFRTSRELAGWSQEERSDLWAWMLKLYNKGQLKAPEVEIMHWGSPAQAQDGEELEKKLLDVVEKTANRVVGMPKQIFVFEQ
ncbi:hypothetical protein PILCRDRAFT_78438 [Piloderma croceum F 1598]|uniref:enoyl-[acyl-carrier-protein] reductase n=1 Tax=Piloderma croceum (strain F 1598) TaxID=765440 RepID=A0A0C3ETG9_PILCF|nr:hypothetical protein PILCRDRAFT_78438 [Piloderma croceum F 1598]